MPATVNTSSDLTLNLRGVELGQNIFQSFLLAGERYLQANMQRPNTDEARFRDFYAALPVEAKEPITSYFKRQAGLNLAQRAQIIGNLTNLRIESPLTIYQTAPVLTAAADFQNIARQIITNRGNQPSPPPPAPPTPPATDFDVLRLYVNKLTVEKAQDAYSIPLLGTFNTTDEVTLGYIGVDETGDVSYGNQTIGDIAQGSSKSYPGDGLKLYGFNLHEGNSFPKFYSMTVVAIERDNGGYNQVLQKAADYVKDKVTKELLARGVIGAGAYFGITIPPDVANYIANVVKTFFDKLINWLAGLLHNDDDVLGTATATATINGLNGAWVSTGNLVDKSFDWVFSGQGGRWRTTMHWQLIKN